VTTTSVLSSSVYIQAEELALLALVLIWPVAALAQTASDRRARIALWAVVIGLVTTTILTGTRAAQLTVVLLAAGYASRFVASKRRAVALVAGLLAVIGAVTLAVPYQRARLFDGVRQVTSGTDTRLQLARISAESVPHHPLLGTGAGSFEAVVRSRAGTFPQAYQRAEARNGLAAHNDLEIVLVESGLLGAVCWIALLGTITWTVLRTGIVTGLESLVRLRWAWLLSAFIASQALVTRFQNVIWLMVGVSGALYLLSERPQGIPASPGDTEFAPRADGSA